MRQKHIVIFIWMLLFCSHQLLAEKSRLILSTPAAYLVLNFGMVTSKSQFVESNDTGTSSTYTLGTSAGKQKNIGFSYTQNQISTKFVLNDSAQTILWADTELSYRWAYLRIGAVFSQVGMQINNAGNDTIDASGNGIGGSFGVEIPISRIGVFQLKTASISFANTRNKLEQDITLGTRTDIKILSSFNITRNLLDFLVGYQIRTWHLSNEDKAKEEQQTTFLGFRIGGFF